MMEKASTKNDLFRIFFCVFFGKMSPAWYLKKRNQNTNRRSSFLKIFLHITPAKITTNVPKNGPGLKRKWIIWSKKNDTFSKRVVFRGHTVHTPENKHGIWKSSIWKGKTSSKPSFLGFHVKFQGRIPYTKNFMGFFYVETHHISSKGRRPRCLPTWTACRRNLFPPGFFWGKNTNGWLGVCFGGSWVLVGCGSCFFFGNDFMIFQHVIFYSSL